VKQKEIVSSTSMFMKEDNKNGQKEILFFLLFLVLVLIPEYTFVSAAK
jgi:hypothetical protein